MLEISQKAPDFALQDQNGKIHKLSDYLGKSVLVYFYPKDDTPGCTKEACSFRDNFPHFEKVVLIVLGISTDSVLSHKKFSEKYNLPFTILSDETKEVVRQYGVWGLKKFAGKEYFGILRTSFLVDRNGKIVKIYEKVEPEIHAEEILADIKIFGSI